MWISAWKTDMQNQKEIFVSVSLAAVLQGANKKKNHADILNTWNTSSSRWQDSILQEDIFITTYGLYYTGMVKSIKQFISVLKVMLFLFRQK